MLPKIRRRHGFIPVCGARGALARARAITIAALLATGGCAVGPDFHPRPVEAPAHWKDWHGGEASLAGPESDAGATLPGDPWEAFHDPELSRLIERARASNPDLRIAMLHLVEARMQESTVTAQRGPQLNGSLDATRRRDSEFGAETRIVDVIGGANPTPILKALGEPYSLYRPGFDASWEPDLWGRQRRSEESAHASTAEQAASLREAQLVVAADVARNYFTLRTTQRQLELLQGEIGIAEDELRLLAAQQGGGQIDESAVNRERQFAADLRSLAPSLQSQEAQALNALTMLLGGRPGELNAELAAPASAPFEFEAARADLDGGLPSEFARRRPDIAAAEARLHAATANVGVAVAELYPSVTLGASFGLESVGTARLSSWGARDWSVGPSITVPVFDHGRRSATVTLRQLEQQEAAVAYQQTVLKAWHEVDSAISTYRADVRQCAELADKLRHVEDDTMFARVRAEQGTTSQLPNLEARSTSSRARRDLAQCASTRDIALVALFKALGDSGG